MQADRLPVHALRGTVSARQNGRFHEEALRQAGDLQAQARQARDRLPPEADCQRDASQRFDAVLACGKGTPRQNSLKVADLAAVHRIRDGWLSLTIPATTARQFDALGIVERSAVGDVLGRRQVRVPPVPLGDGGGGGGGAAIRNIAVHGRVLTADIVFGRRMAPVSAQDSLIWFEHQVNLSVQLMPLN